MNLLLKTPGRRKAGSHYFCLSEFEKDRYIPSSVAMHWWLCFIPCSWLNALMWKGYKQELKHEDLYATPEESLSQVLYRRFNKLVLPEGPSDTDLLKSCTRFRNQLDFQLISDFKLDFKLQKSINCVGKCYFI